MMKSSGLALPAALCVLAVCPAMQAGNDTGRDALRRTSRAFTAVAREAIPAVVFIQVEKTFEARVPDDYGLRYNDPFGFFGDDFLRRFFRGHGQPPPTRRFRQTGQGTGFLVSEDGYILTNNHVVGDADRITVRLHDGREFEATRVGADARSEVALIRIGGEGFPHIEMGDSTSLEIGEWVIAVGNPFGLAETLTVGVVSAKGRSNMGIAEYEDFIQTDAAINPGNSGGPLINIDGKAIGINTAIFSRSGGYMGIGFAIPIDMARAVMDQLLASGSVRRGYLGVQLNRRDIDEELRALFGLPGVGGVLVAAVVTGSPAGVAGLRDGDVIREVDGKTIKDNQAFRNTISLLGPGKQVVLGVFRDGKALDLPVTMGVYPDDSGSVVRGILERFGFSVRDLSGEMAQRFGYDAGEGVLIDSVTRGSAAEQADIVPGCLVLSVNRVPVQSVAAFDRALARAAKQGRVLLSVRNTRYSWFVLLPVE